MIVFKYATRSRPNLFDRGIESILNNLTNDNYYILVTCDENDVKMLNHHFKYQDNPKIKFVYGHSKNKIDAINRDLSYLPEKCDILINMSDDMFFIQKGFDDIIRQDFNNDYDQCLHYPDGYRYELITMSILGKQYFDRFKYIYHPEYISLWCDNEQTNVAKLLGKYKFFDRQLFIHKHPANDSSVQKDEQYGVTESFFYRDQETYKLRESKNFDII
jgi:hypothetical protein